jgi:hypothetical protein
MPNKRTGGCVKARAMRGPNGCALSRERTAAAMKMQTDSRRSACYD